MINTYDDLLAYFQSMASIYPDDQCWTEGIHVLIRWREFMDRSTINPDDLTPLIITIRQYMNQGSGWFDIALRINAWINEHHIPAQTIFDWNPR